MTLFLLGILVGSGIGFFIASLLSIGHDSDLIDHMQAQEAYINKLAQELAQERAK